MGFLLRKIRLEILHVPVEATGSLGVQGNQDFPVSARHGINCPKSQWTINILLQKSMITHPCVLPSQAHLGRDLSLFFYQTPGVGSAVWSIWLPGTPLPLCSQTCIRTAPADFHVLHWSSTANQDDLASSLWDNTAEKQCLTVLALLYEHSQIILLENYLSLSTNLPEFDSWLVEP